MINRLTHIRPIKATNYCADRGMELPAPTNDLDNRLVRGEQIVQISVPILKHNDFFRHPCQKSGVGAEICASQQPIQVEASTYLLLAMGNVLSIGSGAAKAWLVYLGFLIIFTAF